MTRHVRCIVALCLWAALSAGATGAETRTWTDASGKYRIDAELVDVVDGKVQLKKADGQQIAIALESLSQADRDYLGRLAAGQTAPAAPQPATLSDSVKPGAKLTLELAGGSKLEGELVARDETSLTLRVTVAGRDYTRKVPLERVRAVTVDGQRQQLSPEGGPSPDAGGKNAAPAAAGAQRSREEIKSLIAQTGRTPPDWWDSVRLDYPQTLDLSWPEKPPGKWDAQRNVGQYVWDVINPNPGKWREGVRFMHHLLTLHEKDRDKQVRAMNTLANMYHDLLRDYARAAFWWEKAGTDRGAQLSPAAIDLADCYWRLGSKPMALDLLNRTPAYFSAIKLLSDMGETRRAIQLAESGARGEFADLALLCAGDACRLAGQYRQATGYYQKVLALPAEGKAKKHVERSQQRARECIEGIRIFDALDLARVPDGTYRGLSPGYAGDVKVEVTVRGGRIETVKVVEHKEKQFYASLTDTPAKIIARQGLKGIDTTSGATVTSEAIINATAKALGGAAK